MTQSTSFHVAIVMDGNGRWATRRGLPRAAGHRAGADAERRLPILSAYLGHVHWSDTFWYLSALPQLMHEAMSRLERRWEDRP